MFVRDDGHTPKMDLDEIPEDKTELTISLEGVLTLLENLDEGKSGGPDYLSCKILKLFAPIIASCLTEIFQYSLESRTIPSIWKVARVIPIYKKGSKEMPTNYRPVSLTCVTCKLLEHIVSSKIYEHLSLYNVLHDSQHGFRRGRSCDSQLVHTINDLAFNLDKKIITDVIILDFSKAFDTVNHRKLFYKLDHYGINKELIFWIQNFLTNRRQFVSVDNVDSPLCPIYSGVPQGSVLGPLLFLLYVNDLPDHIRSECRLFADDTLLFNSRENKAELQQDLNVLQEYASKWQLTFNVAKCAVLSIGETKAEADYFLCNQRLSNVESHPYLGIELQSNLKWDKQYNKIISKANRTLFMLRRVLKQADTKTRQIAYFSLVRPLLEYGCTVWDPFLKKDIKRFEKVQNAALRFIFKIKGQVSFTELRENIGMDSLAKRRRDLRCNFYMKAIERGLTVPDFTNFNRHHNTRQHAGLFIPAIKTNAYFNSFWPRTTRDLRDL